MSVRASLPQQSEQAQAHAQHQVSGRLGYRGEEGETDDVDRASVWTDQVDDAGGGVQRVQGCAAAVREEHFVVLRARGEVECAVDIVVLETVDLRTCAGGGIDGK